MKPLPIVTDTIEGKTEGVMIVRMSQWSAREIFGDNSDGLVSINEWDIYDAVKRLSESSKERIEENDLQRIQRAIFEELSKLKVALIVVDFQNDFISGSLRVQEGSANENPLEAIVPLNDLISENDSDLIVFSLDWHPPNHISFVESARDSDRKIAQDKSYGDLKAFNRVEFEVPPVKQVLYPRHCVKNTWGAEIHANVTIPNDAAFIRKGTQVFVDSYSAFSDNNGHKLCELEKLLESSGITAVLGCGLAYDICVRHTLSDANKLGFLSGVVRDCSKGLSKEGVQETSELFASENIAIIESDAAKRITKKEKVPIEWVKKLMGRSIGNGTIS